MRRILAMTILVGATFIASAATTQTDELNVEIPGRALKWIRIAEPRIKREGVNLDNYNVVVFEEGDTISVSLRSIDLPANVRGGGGLEVEISKKTKRITSAHYSR